MSKNALFGPNKSHNMWCFWNVFRPLFEHPPDAILQHPVCENAIKHNAFLMILRQPKSRFLVAFGSENRPTKLTCFLLIFLPFNTLTSRICYKTNCFSTIFCFFGRLSGRLLDLPKAVNATKTNGFSIIFKFSKGRVSSFFMKLLLPSGTSAKRRNSGAINIAKTLCL